MKRLILMIIPTIIILLSACSKGIDSQSEINEFSEIVSEKSTTPEAPESNNEISDTSETVTKKRNLP